MRQGKLGRTAQARRALFRSSVTSLFTHDRIVTTESKAKEMRPIAERLITWAKAGDLHHRRLAAEYVLEPEALKRLFDKIGPAFAERPGGYTRIIKLGSRRGDAAPLALIELVGTTPKAAAAEAKEKAKK
ncbi:MAG: 50S ribosomal protein L17 [Clostridia bacterium]|nr:50S ribosomal protein L17 [Clostridia bacterium]